MSICPALLITQQLSVWSGLAKRTHVQRARSCTESDDLLSSPGGQTDGSLPIYKNTSHCVNERVEDLLSRMTIEEKAGQMFHGRLIPGPNATFDRGNAERNSTEFMVGEQLISHFNLVGTIYNTTEAAQFHNNVQAYILNNTRLGIPLSLSTDPRHAFTDNTGTGALSGTFSQWPESMGLAALRSVDLVNTFGEIAREEYLAIGIRASLHPQVDLLTEARWGRADGTFSEDAYLTSDLLTAYIKAFQGETFGPRSVSTMTKHFPGGGPMEDGEDSHFIWGKNQTYPGNNFDYHLIPFKAAIAAGTRQMMPYYSRPIGTKYPEIAFAFNKPIITDLLKEELSFEGVVVSDWYLVTDHVLSGEALPARAWGVEHYSELERVQGVIDAGFDQFGGEVRPELLVEAVNVGLLSEKRIDTSVRKLLREKFLLGLFDNPFVDVEAAEKVVGNPYFRRVGQETQRRSYTLLSNKDNILPLRTDSQKPKFYIEGFNTSYITSRGHLVVDTPEEATHALLRLKTASQPHPDSGGFSSRYPWGPLEFNSTEQERQRCIFDAVPTIVDMHLTRPAAMPEIIEHAAAVFGSYGSGPDAFLDVVFGIMAPEGRLPFDLPRSTEAVAIGMEDVPFDTRDPVFKFGHGLSYKSVCADQDGKGRCPS
ncbi:glycosyl hydrolase family 3 N terminal domain-containing protein [Sarocladium strictum]